LAHKMALDMGINLYALSGSGVGGKIVEQDILAASQAQSAVLAEAAAYIQHTPLTPMRKHIAERMLQSHQQAPPVTLNVEAEVTELLKRRKSYNASKGVSISINDLLLKATANALKEFPPINARLEGDKIVHHQVVNLGMAVALEEGLVVPVIREAEKLSLQGIARQAADLARRAQQGRIMPDELSGGTFTVSNLGAFGIVSFTPILNPPEAGILGVCAVRDVVKPVNDGFEARKIMGLSLTFDHRVVDGAQGAIFLQKVVKLLENPLLLMA
jgi:pyruvate dehydrogenase E2 component (dihydrolipoamide acetyltransferase)